MAQLNQNKNNLELVCDCGLLHKIVKSDNGLKVSTYGTKKPIEKEEEKNEPEEKGTGKTAEESGTEEEWF